MDYQTLLNLVLAKLPEIGHADKVRTFKYAPDYKELVSCLREYIFHSDAKTNEFIQSAMNQAQAHAVVDSLIYS